jgi:glycosyltransferase involved in cell wall biosynthesis
MKTKVLLISTNADLAGAPVHVKTVTSHLKDKIDFLVIFGEEGPIAEEVRLQGVNVKVVGSLRTSVNLLNDFRALMDVRKIAKKFKPDLIHAHSSKAGLVSRLVAFTLMLPSIYTVHGWGWRGLGKFKALLVYLTEIFCRVLPRSHYVFVSKSVAIDGQSRLKIGHAKSTIIHNGVPDIKYRCSKNNIPLKILMSARIADAKDHETLVRAFEISTICAELTLCGSGTDAPEFLNKIKFWAPNKFSLIHCLGSRGDVRELLAESDIFALISNFEALPISIIEAMASGLPIVATNVGGIPELIQNNKNGILVERSCVSDLSDALNRLSNKNLRMVYGKKARQDFVKKFNSEIMTKKLYNLYKLLSIKHAKN